MFEKTRCLTNIYDLAKEKGIKIGDLEETAGMSKGYLSRVSKPEYQGSPSIEMLDSISEQLGVGIDFLVNYSHETLTPNEQFIMKFLDKLQKRTLAGKMDWVGETSDILTAENNQEVANPMVTITKQYSDVVDVWYDDHVYRSGIFEEGWAIVVGSCYHAKIDERNTLYVNAVRYFKKGDGEFSTDVNLGDVKELYLVTDGVAQGLCSTYYVNDIIKVEIDRLYESIRQIPSRISLEDKTRITLSRFMELLD